ncbi:hypothetical protein J4456_03075 [Candidatus Pacearchaeota archaeon]|nr:hypothetical protein [Candidatus Pacearchaeota archaeon]
MQILEKTKEDIIDRSETMSDFLKMEYLEKCAEKFRDDEILRYCYSQLIILYEGRMMFSDALKYLYKLQAMVFNNAEKLQLIDRELELLIKGGFYDKVEPALKNAMKISSNDIEVMNLRRNIVTLYKQEISKFERSGKYQSLLRIYEKLIPLLADHEKNEAKKRLVEIYNKLGKVRESIELEKSIGSTR